MARGGAATVYISWWSGAGRTGLTLGQKMGKMSGMTSRTVSLPDSPGVDTHGLDTIIPSLRCCDNGKEKKKETLLCNRLLRIIKKMDRYILKHVMA